MLYKTVLAKFDTAFAKLKGRDKALENFRQVFDKLEEIKKQNQLKMKDISQRDPAKEAKDNETQAKVRLLD